MRSGLRHSEHVAPFGFDPVCRRCAETGRATSVIVPIGAPPESGGLGEHSHNVDNPITSDLRHSSREDAVRVRTIWRMREIARGGVVSFICAGRRHPRRKDRPRECHSSKRNANAQKGCRNGGGILAWTCVLASEKIF